MSESVNHPHHYASGKIEVIEAIEDWKLGFNRGNAIKYVARAGKKDPEKEIEDLEKAVWYLKREIEILTSQKLGKSPKRPNDMNAKSLSLQCGICGAFHARIDKAFCPTCTDKMAQLDTRPPALPPSSNGQK